ncbi:choice-of-anchor Q domain-containing protein [Psychroserpens damuponensis]|uniref:choice-of-anchor Q domain-containing protein n=1 Tax=Psychroserpens damuponensis TaxID=943936 RepID=UPI000B21A081|nr:choice-of-anchor Q domain-containing protein [Psychroserpens damuponensis]
MYSTKSTLFLVLSLLFCLQSNATDYYVSNSGNNANNGLTLATAFLTLQHASNLVSAGDTVYVVDGTYAGFDVRDVNGTSTNPITFIAIGDNAIINQRGPIRNDCINIENSDYIIIDGFKVNDAPGNGNGIRVVLSDFCIIRNNFCNNNAERGIFTGFTDDIIIEHNICANSIDEHGIYVSNSSDRPIIRYNECYGNNNIGIHMNADRFSGGDGIISDAQIYGNIIHDNNLAAGINMDGLENPEVYNNLIYNNHSAQGIALFQIDGAIVTNGAKIYNNTIIVPSDGRWGILLQDGANVNTEIYNNIIINEHAWRGCISAESTTQLTSNYNILNNKMSYSGDGSVTSLSDWQTQGLDANSQIANSLSQIFEDNNTNNFHLAENSQAIDAGTNAVNTVVIDDLENEPRPNGSGFDIGSYEYNASLSIITEEYTSFSIFPNPTSNKIYFDSTLNLETIATIMLTTIKGQTIKSFEPSHVLNISNLSSGLYLLHISLKNKNHITKKVLIK